MLLKLLDLAPDKQIKSHVFLHALTRKTWLYFRIDIHKHR